MVAVCSVLDMVGGCAGGFGPATGDAGVRVGGPQKRVAVLPVCMRICLSLGNRASQDYYVGAAFKIRGGGGVDEEGSSAGDRLPALRPAAAVSLLTATYCRSSTPPRRLLNAAQCVARSPLGSAGCVQMPAIGREPPRLTERVYGGRNIPAPSQKPTALWSS
ncbi:hypothetical protein NDU88_008955 [Pleurodeles waltl]|uniref:Uncharacterized protein n=1 Tax=Pleurodeles waltl TaxID=8319 RepID=A0AAV7PRY7_PLEWA|nr:hypothetical protein NDU88_008955 [Pleurodeles waltl]